MAQILALECGGNEARAAIASKHGSRVVIEQAFLIPVVAGGHDAGGVIAEALAARGIGPVDALVAVGRGSVELRQLRLPAAPDEELPEMVRLQALLEFNELDERWLLDFVPVDEEGKGSRSVLAAAIAPELVEQVQAVCLPSNLRLRHLGLRACEAASLLARSQALERGQIQLLVELFSDQADLTVTRDGKVLLLRTTRLAGDPPFLHSLVGEIRLTMAAVQNQFGGRKVTRILLCGQGQPDAALAQKIAQETKTATKLFDPFAGLTLAPALRESPVEQPGRFAAVLGMLLIEFDQTGHAIDFLHPRHAAAPPDPRKKWWLAGAAVAALLAAYLVYGRIEHAWLAREVEQLTVRSQALDAAAPAAEKTIAAAAELGKWVDSQIVWLDQFAELSQDFPPAEKTTLSGLSCTLQPPTAAGRPSRGEIKLEGRALNAEAITAMDQNLRAHGRHVDATHSREDRSVQPYTSTFTTTLFVGPGSKP